VRKRLPEAQEEKKETGGCPFSKVDDLAGFEGGVAGGKQFGLLRGKT